MSKAQLGKVYEMVRDGWKVVTSPPFPPGGPIEMESTTGEKCTVLPDGSKK